MNENSKTTTTKGTGNKRNNRSRNRSNQRCNSRSERGINEAINNDEHAIKKDFRGSVPGGRNNNDASWYALSPQLLSDAGQLSFNNPLGTGLSGIISRTDPYYVPGVMCLKYHPGIGHSKDNSSAVNIAARRLYTYVRHANSGSANYDSPDLMLYVLAVSNAYAMYAYLVRAYGVANVYAQKNRYLPDALLKAMHFNPDEVRANLADFRYGINVLAAKLNQLAIPADMTFVKRQTWLNSNIFSDSTTVKSQLYLYAPRGYFIYNEKTSTAGGFLQYTQLPVYSFAQDEWDLSSGQWTTKQWLANLSAQIDPLIQSEDIGIMAGDILKAYGAGNLLSVPQVGENYLVAPTPANAEVLMQIQNTVLVRRSTFNATGGTQTLSTEANLNITQDPDTGAIIYRPTSSGPSVSLDLHKPITIRSESPTPADIMVATRNMVGGLDETNTTPNTYEFDCYGTEIIAHAVMWINGTRLNQDNNTRVFGAWPYMVTGTYVAVTTKAAPTTIPLVTATSIASQLCRISKFDWHMPVYISHLPEDGTENVMELAVDFDNTTVIEKTTLNKLHETALLSMFNVPSLAGNFS